MHPLFFLQVNYRKEEAKILDSVMGTTVYDSRIRPSGINGTGDFLFWPQTPKIYNNQQQIYVFLFLHKTHKDLS